MENVLIEPSTRNRNKIGIQKICPVIPKNELIITNKNSILGISINNPATTGNKILAIFDFLHKRGLTQINLLMGDSLYRYTAMIKHGCNEDEASIMGAEQNKQLMEYYTSYVNNNNTSYQLKFFLTSEIKKENDFNVIHEKIWELFDTDSEFKTSVMNFSNYYFSRVGETATLSVNENCQYAYKYLIEELAIFAILNQRGLNILIYPGVIQTIYDIITMNNPYLSNLFKNYIFVSLRIKRN